MVVFNEVVAKAQSMKLDQIRIRGIEIQNKFEDGLTLVRIEVICYSEDGIPQIISLFKELKDKMQFVYVRIMGDNIDKNLGTDKTKVGEKGFLAMMEGFTLGLFTMTYEFRFFNFDPEPTPMLAFVDSLMGNMSLSTIGFARNNLN